MKKYLFLAPFLLLLYHLSFCQIKPQQRITKTNTVLQRADQGAVNQQTIFYGRVLDGGNRYTISGARVIIFNVDSNIVSVTTETNSDGVYQFTPRMQTFRVEVTKSGYNKYTSSTYTTREFYGRRQAIIPEILLSKASESGTSDGPRTQPGTPTPTRDTTPLPKEEFLSKKLFTEYNVLPSSSSYALYYALNPSLKNMDQVPADYQIIKPNTPVFSSSLKKKLSTKFSDDSEKDNGLQQSLQDSITAYHNYYDAFQSNTSIQYNGVSSDTARKLLSIINNDLRTYENDIKSTRKAKNIQLNNVVVTCSGVLRQIAAKKMVNREDVNVLMGLSSYLSSLVESASFINYFRRILGSSSAKPPRSTDETVSPQFAAYFSNSTSKKNNYLLINDSRPFNVSVHLQKGDRPPISSGEEVNGRFIVSFYPAALKAIKALYIDCDPLATFGGVTLMEGIYEQMVIDSRTGKEMVIVGSGSNTINTKKAFQKPAKDLFGKAIFTEIQILVKE